MPSCRTCSHGAVCKLRLPAAKGLNAEDVDAQRFVPSRRAGFVRRRVDGAIGDHCTHHLEDPKK